MALKGGVVGASALYSKMDPKTQYIIEDVLYNTEVIGSVLRTRDAIDYYDAYLKAHDMDWSDIKYHKVNLNAGAVVDDTLNFVSSNLTKLYR